MQAHAPTTVLSGMPNNFNGSETLDSGSETLVKETRSNRIEEDEHVEREAYPPPGSRIST